MKVRFVLKKRFCFLFFTDDSPDVLESLGLDKKPPDSAAIRMSRSRFNKHQKELLSLDGMSDLCQPNCMWFQRVVPGTIRHQQASMLDRLQASPNRLLLPRQRGTLQERLEGRISVRLFRMPSANKLIIKT